MSKTIKVTFKDGLSAAKEIRDHIRELQEQLDILGFDPVLDDMVNQLAYNKEELARTKEHLEDLEMEVRETVKDIKLLSADVAKITTKIEKYKANQKVKK